LSLLEDGELRPTVGRIAEQAGISARSVYVHFDDLDDLFAAAARRQAERFRSLVEAMPEGAPLDERVDTFVRSRARVLEAIAPVRRAALLHEPFLPALARLLDGARRHERREVEHAFARELERLTAGARRRVGAALDVATGWPAWETLRTHHGMSQAVARRTMTETVHAILDTARS
jgi:AcrR family transcriptional regulator